MIIYPFNTKEVLIPSGQKMALSSFGDGLTDIEYYTTGSNHPVRLYKTASLRNRQRILGPFDLALTVRISTGSDPVEYQVGFNPSNDPRILNARSSCCLLGDSMHARGWAATGMNSIAVQQWYNDLAAANGAELDIRNVYAVGGKTLEQVLTQQIPSAIADSNDVMWIHAGVNNFDPGFANHDSVDTMLNVIRSILDLASPAKPAVIFDSICPVKQGGSFASIKSRAAEFPYLNAGIQRLCNTYPNVIFNDLYSLLRDPDVAVKNLDPVANALVSDGVHYQSFGAKIAGYGSFGNISPRLRISKYATEVPIALPVFSGTGGTKTVGSGTITGTPPAGWNCEVVSGSAAVTIAVQAPNTVRLTITNGGGTESIIRLQVIDTAQLLAAVKAGDVIQSKFGFQARSMVAVNRIATLLRFSGVTTWYGGTNSSTDEPTVIYPPEDLSGVRICPPYTIPSTPSNLEYILTVNVAATTGEIVIDLFNPKLNKLV